MSRVFLMGPLAWRPLMEVVLGAHLPTSPVVLTNVAPGPSSAFSFPHIHDKALADAVSVELDDPDTFDALSFFAAALGAHPVPKHGVLDGKRASGILFVADGPLQSASMPVEDWIAAWGDLALTAAHEIMGYHGRVPAADLSWRMSMILSRAVSVHAARATPGPISRRRDMPRDAVTVHRKKPLHEGFFLTRGYQLQYPNFDGRQSDALHREVFVAADAVIVLPYDPVRDRVLLVEQFRMGPFARGDIYPWVFEPPAGRVDAGETVEEAARRECEEEAGLTLSRLEHVSSHYCSPGASTEYYHCFVALTDLPDEAAGLGGLDTEHEDIRTHVLEFDQAMHLVSTGEANIGPMILLLMWLQRERPRLRSLA
ncbi:MAG: NUDIX domain-containing protein [Pseudomonadota bacterium]